MGRRHRRGSTVAGNISWCNSHLWRRSELVVGIGLRSRFDAGFLQFRHQHDRTAQNRAKPSRPPISFSLCANSSVRGAQIKVQLGKQSPTQELRYHLINGDEILGEAFLDDPSTLEAHPGISEVLCLQVFLVQTMDGSLEHSVLLLVPRTASNERDEAVTQAYKRIGVGFIWHVSKHDDGSHGSIEPFRDVPLTGAILE